MIIIVMKNALMSLGRLVMGSNKSCCSWSNSFEIESKMLLKERKNDIVKVVGGQ